jgi:dethiobiotin synthetase
MKSYFITGTDTGIGKTFVTLAMLAALQSRGIRAAPMKPVAAGGVRVGGCLVNDDVALMQEMSNHRFAMADVNPYCLAAPIAPHIAAAREAANIDLAHIVEAYARLKKSADLVLVEGAGGFLVPLSASQSMAAIPQVLGLDVVLVVAMRLGCLNHALLSAEAIRARGLSLAGWVANAISTNAMDAEADNLATLDAMMCAPCLGIIPHLSTSSAANVADSARRAARYLRLDSILADREIS